MAGGEGHCLIARRRPSFTETRPETAGDEGHGLLKGRGIGHAIQDTGPDAPVPPAAKPPVRILPAAVFRREVPPGRSGAQYPEHGVQKPAVVLGWPTSLASPSR